MALPAPERMTASGKVMRPFRRMTKGLLVPVAEAPTWMEVPEGFIDESYTAFMIVNPNVCWVGLGGTSGAMDKPKPTVPNMASPDGTDWLFPPGHVAVYSTQYPVFMSAVAIAMPGFELPGQYVPLRVYYGYGV